MDDPNILDQGGSPVGLTLASGNYTTAPSDDALSTLALTDGKALLVPLAFSRAVDLDRIGIEVTGAGAGSVIRLGWYPSSGGIPVAPVFDAGTIDGTSATAQTITIAQRVEVGRYWLVAVAQGGAPTVRSIVGDLVSTSVLGTATGSRLSCYGATGVAGALPSSPPSFTSVDAAAPRIVVRVA